LQTIFFGGGTPTALPVEMLQQILAVCFSSFAVDLDAEVSMEANPGTVDAGMLEKLRKSGVNRLSFGVQSFVDGELKKIGRIHTADEAAVAVQLAGDAGFENISIDLMYGLPAQSAKSWQFSLEKGVSLAVRHLSLYQLTLEENTPMGNLAERGEILLPDDDTVDEIDELTAKCTAAAGFSRYEISNYSRQNSQCRHNIIYWKNEDYIGIGAGAVSGLNGRRMRNVDDPAEYCSLMEAGASPVVWEEQLEREASFRETVIMGLRMNSGLCLSVLKKRYGIATEEYYGEILRRLLREELLHKSADTLCLTAKGRRFANRVMAELV
jgi:oxygen-independent coproporphyrinogen-3 oxidase